VSGENGAAVQLRSAGCGALATDPDPVHLLNLAGTSAPPRKMGVASGTGRLTDARPNAQKLHATTRRGTSLRGTAALLMSHATKRRAIVTTMLNAPVI